MASGPHDCNQAESDNEHELLLATVQTASPPPLSPRPLTAMTYALCGFVHVASMGICVGSLSALVPHRAKDISLLGLRALWTAYLTTLLTGCIAGVLGAS